MSPGASESGQRILHASEGDLKHSLTGVRAIGKDIQNHFLAVNHRDLGVMFPVALLGRSEPFVEHDYITFQHARLPHDFIDLPFADEGSRRGLAEIHNRRTHDANPEILDQFLELGQKVLSFAGRHVRGLDAH